jgi:hypothetical protein
MPVVDLPLDAGHDLVGERLVAPRADSQGQHAGSRLNWPGHWTSTVMPTDGKIVYYRTAKCSAVMRACQAEQEATGHPASAPDCNPNPT